MINSVVIVTIIISIACGSYALILLNRLRKMYRLDFLNSFFYYELLHLAFGLYGILGGAAIREILLKFDLQNVQVETIVAAIPFFGVPFLVAGWFMLLKMAGDLGERKVPPYLSIIYFIVTTLAFLVYGLILKSDPENRIFGFGNLTQLTKIAFYTADLAVKFVILFMLIGSALRIRVLGRRLFLTRLGAIFAGLSIMSALALHFSSLHTLVGLYFIMIYFGGDLALIMLTRSYLSDNATVYSDFTDKTEALYQKYGITRREREIISEICSRLTNQQIADKLFISLQTVKDHTHNIFRKAGVSNRVQLTQLFSQL